MGEGALSGLALGRVNANGPSGLYSSALSGRGGNEFQPTGLVSSLAILEVRPLPIEQFVFFLSSFLLSGVELIIYDKFVITGLMQSLFLVLFC